MATYGVPPLDFLQDPVAYAHLLKNAERLFLTGMC